MRLFYAITFNSDVKKKLCVVMDEIKPYCKSGRFTAAENLHLTLVFLGETPFDRIAAARKAADAVDLEPFSITLSGIGCFRHRGGDIIWIGAERSQKLLKIYECLCAGLKENGFKTEDRAYSPHVTLARQAVFSGDPNCFLSHGASNIKNAGLKTSGAVIELPVEKISLMKSERINGKLKYTEIYGKSLKGEG